MPRKVKRSNQWFIKVRGSYLPNSWQAWLLYVPYVTWLLMGIFFAAYSHEAVVARILITGTAWYAGAATMTWIAAKKS